MTYVKKDQTNQDQQSSGGFLAGVVLGGIIGAAVALLTSPKSGREVRTYLDEKTSTSRERLTVKSKEVREKAEPVVGEWIKVASDKAAPVLNLVKDKAREAAELKQQVDEDELSIEEAMEKADQLVAEAEAEVKEQLDQAAEETSSEATEQADTDAKPESAQPKGESNSKANKSNTNKSNASKQEPKNSRDESANYESDFEAPVKDLLDDESKQELKELKNDLKNGNK
ncbi:YtxH domain-containing protein [Exiguobacterium sp. SH3S2]|uniref:YtxH domain-containing protein n=1 Tax=unclassified Exiguobacterium TaxID=2644629 RepID=UPI0010394A33|nr:MULTISPECIES: YtxH domain-containing protein [unclassified Exiguobacterium]TCI27817.1 YtxH domain-containing protein [Exiguobacterium sp. SH5S4]TCI48825.1 YtxH domain-containing protein [Exiguobacterium sp. SH3S3]TCI55610.1 YtxH domain-containing protein [Exiguobacterium sp. SH5S13]TCI63689.1 YtxH domain-containing protein [Exiguobacterium sp. SH3S2]